MFTVYFFEINVYNAYLNSKSKRIYIFNGRIGNKLKKRKYPFTKIFVPIMIRYL